MMSLILLAAPLGVTIGYGFTGFIISKGLSWKYAFNVIGLVMVASSVILVFVPERFLDIDECIRLKRAVKETKNESIYKQRSNHVEGELGGTIQFMEPNQIAKIEEAQTSQEITDSLTRDSRNTTFKSNLKQLMCNVPYVCSVCCMSVLFFVVSGI